MHKAVRICHVTSVHKNTSVRILKKECESLAKDQRYEVFEIGNGESFKEGDVRVIGVSCKRASRLYRFFIYSRQVAKKALELNADIYHLHDPELLLSVKLLSSRGAKVIFDSHENILESIDEKTYMPKLVRKIAKLFYYILQKKVLPKVDGIIVVTPKTRAAYECYNDNITVVTNYPIIKYKGLNNYNRNNTFIFAGGISRQWSHNEIISAIAHIDDIEYKLYGNGSSEYITELKAISNFKNVSYGGVISFDEVQAEIENAGYSIALLKPSKNTHGMEGTLGNTKLFEAMSHGKPVIATNFSLWKDIVEEYNCGICVDPNNVEEISKAINKLLSMSDEEYYQMSKNCIYAVIEHYSWDVTKKNLFELYERILEEKQCNLET